MNSRLCLPAAALLATCSASALAENPVPSLPPVQAARFVADCAHPVLPGQREVGEWTGWNDPGQAYAARDRLMHDIARACQRAGITHMRVVATADARARPDRRVVVARP